MDRGQTGNGSPGEARPVTPESRHPIEKRARSLALVLHGVTNDSARRLIMQAHLLHVYDDLTCLDHLAETMAIQHVNAIVARALEIEDAGRPVTVPAQRPDDGLAEFLEQGR